MFQKDILPSMQKSLDEMRAAGVDVWPGYAHVSPTSTLSLYKSLIFAQSNDYVWHEVVLAETNEEKARMLADPEWRARARESWDTKAWTHSPMNNPQRLNLFDSENGVGPLHITLQDYIDQTGLHRAQRAVAATQHAFGGRGDVAIGVGEADNRVPQDILKMFLVFDNLYALLRGC
jgi:hypothetical protein